MYGNAVYEPVGLTFEQKCSRLGLREEASFGAAPKLPPGGEVSRMSGARARCWQPRNAYLGQQFTIVKDLKKEIGPGLLAAMCKQLGIRKEDL